MATDVCRALNCYVNSYGTVNTTIAVAKLNVFQVQRVPYNRIVGGTYGKGTIIVIDEGGLYAMIQRSDKPEARVFQDWVNGTVLPAIRKTGGYLLNEAARATAHADTREAMPLPMDIAEALAPFMAAQQETNRLLTELLAVAGRLGGILDFPDQPLAVNLCAFTRVFIMVFAPI